jgi:hypothetical protein
MIRSLISLIPEVAMVAFVISLQHEVLVFETFDSEM